MFQDKFDTLKDWISQSNSIVFFGGAGVSTESGIPDFRSTDGVYHMKYSDPPETILSHSYFTNHTREFYDFYLERMIYSEAIPNITHTKLAELEAKGKLQGVVTQNIDGLHQKAGCKKVFELHGSVLRNFCMKCNKFYEVDYIEKQETIPICDCGGIIKPDVVLYEENLDEQVMSGAINLINHAEVLIVAGTSLSVYPAAGLIRYYQGNKLVLINKTVTPYDKEANLLFNTALGEVFSAL
ncbi:MAG: NAD-dependent protein deacylase [Mobilitalea sp.]